MHVDKTSHEKVVSFLKHLSLTTDEIHVYLHLIEHDPQTVVAISKGLQTGRTKLYPILQSLVAKQLLVMHERHYGTSYAAAPVSNLEYLVADREKQASILRKDLLETINILFRFTPHQETIASQYDDDGLKQAYWAMSQYTGVKRIVTAKAVRMRIGSAFLSKHPVDAIEKTGTTHEIYIYGDTVSILTVNGATTVTSKAIADHYVELLF